MARKRKYLTRNVHDEMLLRLAFVFDRFEHIVISVSGGKDSTVLYHAAMTEARKRGRKINLFFIDQEAEYDATIRLMREMMQDESVIPHWYQVPIHMTNAVSYTEKFMSSWNPKAANAWMRQKETIAITENPFPGADRFYTFINAFERSWPVENTAFLVGLRSEESLHRYSAVTRNPGLPGIDWCTKRNGAYIFYPISHFAFEDVWYYISKFKIHYNEIYDKMMADGYHVAKMRVSYLLHEKSFKCLGDLERYEPDTFERLLQRVPGVDVAARLVGQPMGLSVTHRPEGFSSWIAYRDHLLTTVPEDMRLKFEARFARQLKNEFVGKQQCRRILIGDWENSVPIRNEETPTDALAKWRKIL